MAIALENKSGGRIGLGIGWHSRIEPISTYLFKKYLPNGSFSQPNINIAPSQALHQVISYDQRMGEHTRMKVEAYLQNINQVPVDTLRTGLFSMVNYSSGIPSQVLENAGKGINKGIELTLERFLADDFYYLITASLFDSKFQNKDLKWRNTQFNNLFASTILVGKDFKLAKQKSLSMNIRYLIRGGNRYTPINLAESIKRNTTVNVSSKAFEAQYPNFERIDISVAYRINKLNRTWSFRLDLQNVFNTKNVIEERYDSSLRGLSYRYALPLIPIISSQLEF
jgi:outer membrane receptor protein involved in Fe transport